MTHEEVDAEALGGAAIHTGRSGVAHLAAGDEAQAMDAVRRLLAHLPQNNLGDAPAIESRRIRATGWTPSSTRSCPTTRRRPYDMHDVIRRVVDDGELARDPAGVGREHPGRVRAARRARGRHRRAAARGARGRARHRRVGQGRAVRADVRRVQRAARHLRRRAGVPARRRAGARRDHPPRREAAVRLLRGDGAQGHGHHAQGVRRRVRRHEQQAHPRRLQLRVADARRSR